MTKRVLVVGCGFPQLGLLRFCRQQSFHVIGLDRDPRAVGAVHCQDFVEASTTDIDAIAQALKMLAVDGVTTCGSEHAVYPVAVAAQRVGLPFYATPDVVEATRFKHIMRARYEAGGAPTPPHAVVRTLADAEAFLRVHPLPAVIKPSRGWGQRGVRILHHPEEVSAAFDASMAAAAGAMETPFAILEKFIPGREFSVNAYTTNGVTEVLCITERIITGYPDPPGITFAEVCPSGLSAEGLEEVRQAAAKGVAALGIHHGPTYTQVRLGMDGAFIVETAHRLGGGLDPDVTFLASGISLYRRLLGTALGKPEWERSRPEGPAHGGAIGKFIIGQPGILRDIRGLEEARRMHGVVDAELYVSVGGRIDPLTDGSKRIGHVLAHGTDRQDAERNAQNAIDQIQLVVDASGSAS